MKGFPVWQMFVVSIIRFSEPLTFTSIFPFIYFLIKSFKIADDDKSISKYSGYLTASFAFTQFLCCIHWGTVSDKIGRKPVLMIGLSGTAISMLIFAFSTNFYMALFARSLAGALNGNISTLRVMIGEIATERRHQSVAFSTLPLLWNLGSVLGPLIGAYFTKVENPKVTTLTFKLVDKFMNKFPYALSSIVVSMFLFCSLIFGILFLEETHYKAKYRRDIGLELGDYIRSKLGYKIPIRPWELKKPKKMSSAITSSTMVDESPDNETTPLIDDETPLIDETPGLVNDESIDNYDEDAIRDEDDDSIESNPLMSRRYSSAIIRRYSKSAQSTKSQISMTSTVHESVLKSFFNREIFTPVVLKTITANFVLGFHLLIYTEFLPIFLAGDYLPQELKFPFRITGGFGWNSQEIGKLLSVNGFCGILVNMFVFPILDHHVRTIIGLRLLTMIFPIVYLNVAFLIFTTNGYNSRFSDNFNRNLFYFNGAFGSLAQGTAFPQIMMLIHRAAPIKYRSLVNSTNLSATSFLRFISPILFGKLMTVLDKLKLGGFPWIFISMVALGGFIQSLFLEEHDEDLKSIDV